MSDDISVLGIAVEQRGVKEGTSALDKLAAAGKKAEQSTDGLTGASKKATFEISALAKVAATALAGYSIAGMATEYIKTADAMSLMNARLRLVTSSQSEFAAVQSGIIALSKENRAGIDEMSALYVRLAPSIKEAGGGMAETMKIVDSFSKSLKLGGASAQEAASATLQFAQAMGAGRLNGDEFRSLSEASPRFMRAIAESIGEPVGALKDMAAEGKLTADVVGNALIKMNSQLTSEFQSLPGTVGDAMTQVRNEFKLAVGDINTASGSTSALATSISDLAAEIRPIGAIFAEASKGMKGAGDQSDVLNAAMAGVRVTIEALLVSGANVGYVFSAMGREIGGIAAQMVALSKGDFAGFSAIGDAMKEDAAAARKAIDDYSDGVLSAHANSKKKVASAAVAAPVAATALKPPSSYESYLADTSNAPRAAKISAAVEKENKAFKAAVESLKKTDADYTQALAKATAAHNERIAEITKEPKGSGGGSDGIANATLSFDLARIKRESDQLAAIYAGSERIIEANHAAGLMSDKEYYESKAAFIRLNAEAQESALQKEIDRLSREKVSGKERIDNLQKIADAQAQIDKIRLEAGFATAINGTQEEAAIRKVAQAYESARASAQSYIDTIRLQSAREIAGYGMGSEYRKEQGDQNRIEDKFLSRRSSLDEQKRAGQITQEAYDEYLSIARKTYEEEVKIHATTREAILGKQADWSVGASEALANYLEETRNVAKQTESLFTNAFQSAEDAFVEFAKTGKLSFSDLADSIIADLARMAYKSAMGPLTESLGGIIGSLFSVDGARASGGSVSSGGTYLVGEKGPELLTMGGNGYITPNNALGSNVVVNLVESPGSGKGGSTSTSTGSNGEQIITVLVEKIKGDLIKDVGSGGSFASAMEGQYSLNRSAGAWR